MRKQTSTNTKYRNVTYLPRFSPTHSTQVSIKESIVDTGRLSKVADETCLSMKSFSIVDSSGVNKAMVVTESWYSKCRRDERGR